MPNIIWEGNKKEFGTNHQSPPIQGNAIKLRDSDGFINKALLYGILPMMLCMLAVFLKAFKYKEPPMEPLFLIPGLIIGFIETITLTWTVNNGNCSYYVYDFSNGGNSSSMALSYSSAKIVVYKGNTLLTTYNVPVWYSGTKWDVFTINNGVLTTIN